MPSPARSAARRRVAVARLAVVPAALALALPAHAATSVEVTPSPESCGIVLAVSGLSAGEHTATVTVTSSASGEVVPALPEPDDEAAADGRDEAAVVGEGDGAQDDTPTTAELVLSGDDDEVVVALDPEAVPDDDTGVVVEVLVDGEPAADLVLTLTACGPQPPGMPAPSPGATPSGTPTPSPTATPSGSPAPSGSPTPAPPTASGSPSGAPTGPSPTPSSSSAPAVPTQPPPAVPAPSDPASRSRDEVPLVTGTTTGSTGTSGPVLGGTGSSGYLASLGWGTSGRLGQDAAAPVPAPVIAPPVGVSAVTSGDLLSSPRQLDELLDGVPDATDTDASDEADAVLAAPQLSTATTPDPLVELAPAAFFLVASLGGMLTAGRRRSR